MCNREFVQIAFNAQLVDPGSCLAVQLVVDCTKVNNLKDVSLVMLFYVQKSINIQRIKS